MIKTEGERGGEEGGCYEQRPLVLDRDGVIGYGSQVSSSCPVISQDTWPDNITDANFLIELYYLPATLLN